MDSVDLKANLYFYYCLFENIFSLLLFNLVNRCTRNKLSLTVSFHSISKFDERCCFLYVHDNSDDFQIYFSTEEQCGR